MCWSLSASAASLVAGVWAPAALLWYLNTADNLPVDAVRLCSAVVAVLVLPGLVELADTLAHAKHRRLLVADEVPVAGLAYVAVALQPAVLAGGVALCLSAGVVQSIMVLVASVVVLHLLGCLAFDAPLTRWLTIQVEEREGSSMCALVHGFFAYEGGQTVLFGVDARVGVYFVSLFLACTGAILAAVDLGSADPFDERARLFVILLAAVLAILLVLSMLIVNYVTLVRGHTSSVWCQLSLLSLVGLGVYLTAEASAAFAGIFVASTLGSWLGVYAAVTCLV